MIFRYEVWIESGDVPVEKVWGPAASLDRAREVAQAIADRHDKATRIDEVTLERVGDPYPEYEYHSSYTPLES